MVLLGTQRLNPKEPAEREAEDQSKLCFRVFIHSSRRDNTPLPSIVSSAFEDDSVKTLSDAHGWRCRGEIAKLIHYVLRSNQLGFVVVGTFDYSQAVNNALAPSSSLLNQPLKTFPFSVRVSNCFEHAQLVRLGDLIEMSEAKLLKILGFGRKSLNEVKSFLEDLNIRTQMTLKLGAPPCSSASTVDLGDLYVVYLHTLRTIASLDIPPPTIKVLRRHGLHHVAQLTQLRLEDVAQLIPESLATTTQALCQLGLDFGTTLPAWEDGVVSDVAAIFANEISCHEEHSFGFLDLELLSLLEGLVSPQKRQIAVRYYGWDGQGGTTLEEVGEEFGFTRERIRQIVSRIQLPWGTHKETLLSSLGNAFRVACTTLPCRAEFAEEAILEAGLVSKPFRLEGLLNAAELLANNPRLKIVRWEKTRLLVADDDRKVVSAILSEARKRISHYGVTSIRFLTAGLEKQSLTLSPKQLGSLVSLLPGFVWLDDAKEWFWSASVPRSALLTRLRKVLAVARELSLSDAHKAVLRDTRMRQVELPEDVFRRLCEELIELCDVDGNVLHADASLRPELELSEVEQTLFDVLHMNGGVLGRSALRHHCCSLRGMNSHTFERYLSESPIIITHGTSVYGLVGSLFDSVNWVKSEDRKQRPEQSQNDVSSLCLGDDFPIGAEISADLDPESGDFGWMCAARMLIRADRLGLPGKDKTRWSLCELRWSDKDLLALRSWGARGVADLENMRNQRLRLERLEVTGPEAIALTFLAFCMTIGRKTATEGELWPYVYRALNRRLVHCFFSAKNVPRTHIRDLTEDVCTKLGLRHVFGEDGAQSWIRTVYLQFGFTLQALTRLPFWLSGSKPSVTVSDLLDSDLSSREFCRAWLTLGELRRGLKDESSARADLANNPWIACDASDPELQLVINASQAHQRELDVEPDQPSSVSEILRRKSLRWLSDEPVIEFDVASAWPEEFTELEYVIDVKGFHRAVARRDERGEYAVDREILLPLVERTMRVDILSHDESVIGQEIQLQLCDDEEEILLFDLTKRKQVDIWDEQLNLKRAYEILCKSDLCLSPEATRSRRVLGGGWTLHSFPIGLPADLRIQLGDQLLWTVPTTESQKSTNEQSPDVVCLGGVIGAQSVIRVQKSIAPNVVGIYVGKQLVRSGTSRDMQFTIQLLPTVDYRRTKASVIVEDGSRLRRVSARFLLQSPVTGAALERSGTWSPANGEQLFDKADFGTGRLIVRPPSHWLGTPAELEDWALMEGASFCARLRNHRLANLDNVTSGLGQPLTLAIGPYNNSDSGIPIARAVVDSGILKELSISDNAYSLILRHDIELNSNHQIWAWRRGEPVPKRLLRGSWVQQGRTIVISDSPEDLISCAISFNAAWLGSCVRSDGFDQFAELIKTTEEWIEVAQWVQWWRIPLLYEKIRTAISLRIRRQPLETFRVWFCSGPNANPMSMRSSHPHWEILLREFFWHWTPTEKESQELLASAGILTGNPGLDVERGWTGLIDLTLVNPVLAALLALRGLKGLYPNASLAEARSLIILACNEIAGLARQSANLVEAKHALLSEAVRQMRVDRAFIEKGLLHEARELYNGREPLRQNLRVAYGVQPFRKWLTMELIEQQLTAEHERG